MKSPRIFWLDDHPDIEAVEYIENLSNGQISRARLLEHTIFAYDYKSGERLVSKEDYDLYMMDGDFPMEMNSAKLEAVQKFMEELKQGVRNPRLRTDMDGTRPNAFIEFTLDYLLGKNFAVYSSSLDAEKSSFLLGWPFYKKGRAKEVPSFIDEQTAWHDEIGVPSRLRSRIYDLVSQDPRWKKISLGDWNAMEIKKTKDSLENWEYGGSQELVTNRLAPLFSETD